MSEPKNVQWTNPKRFVYDPDGLVISPETEDEIMNRGNTSPPPWPDDDREPAEK